MIQVELVWAKVTADKVQVAGIPTSCNNYFFKNSFSIHFQAIYTPLYFSYKNFNSLMGFDCSIFPFKHNYCEEKKS